MPIFVRAARRVGFSNTTRGHPQSRQRAALPMGCSEWITPTRRMLLLIVASRPLSGMPTMRHFHGLGVTRPGAHQALRFINLRRHLKPATTTGPVTPDGARESGQPWWLAALGPGSQVRQPQSGTTLLPLCLQGPSDGRGTAEARAAGSLPGKWRARRRSPIKPATSLVA